MPRIKISCIIDTRIIMASICVPQQLYAVSITIYSYEDNRNIMR